MKRSEPVVDRGPMPEDFRRNYIHLVLDIGWFGVLSGSAVAFISIYLVRVGASGYQVGLVSALPAMVAVSVALPSGRWLRQRPVDRAVFWSSVYFRFFYLAWVLLPLIAPPGLQVWLFLLSVLLMSIPGTMLAVGFNALFAAAVPAASRARVAGVRNAVLAVVTVATSLFCGWLLQRLPFPLGYQVVFGLGFVGAAMSSVHLGFVRVPAGDGQPLASGRSLGDLARPGGLRALGDAFLPGVGLRFLLHRGGWQWPHSRVLRGAFGPVLAVLFLFHLTQYLAIPLFPIYWVDALSLTDPQISLGNAIFYATVFLGSTMLNQISGRRGHHWVLTLGGFLMVGYPLLTALTRDVTLFLITSAYGGIAWALAGGALANYILESVPDDDRPAYLAWYNVALNAAILIGSLAGPLAARWLGLGPALAFIALLRLGSATAIWRRG